jgi:hypothetical protein
MKIELGIGISNRNNSLFFQGDELTELPNAIAARSIAPVPRSRDTCKIVQDDLKSLFLYGFEKLDGGWCHRGYFYAYFGLIFWMGNKQRDRPSTP